MPGLSIENFEWTRRCPKDIEFHFVVVRDDGGNLSDYGPNIHCDFTHYGSAGGVGNIDQPAPYAQRQTISGVLANCAGNLHVEVFCGDASVSIDVPITNAPPGLSMSAQIGPVVAPDALQVTVQGSITDECPTYCSTNVRTVWIDEMYVEHEWDVSDYVGAVWQRTFYAPANSIGMGFYGRSKDPFDVLSWEVTACVMYPKPARPNYTPQ